MSGNTRELRVETVSIADLKPYHRNARKHSKKQIAQIAESMRQFGWTVRRRMIWNH